jgi:hypothetical protein
MQSIPGLPHQSPEFLSRVSALVAEMPAVVAQFAAEARQYAAMIESGAARIPGTPQPVKVAPSAPHIARQEVYLTEHGSWREGDEIKSARQYSIAFLPTKIAKRALEKHLAVTPDSETCAKLKALYGIMHGFTALDLCVDLESGERPADGPRYFDEQSGEVIGKAVAGTASISQ